MNEDLYSIVTRSPEQEVSQGRPSGGIASPTLRVIRCHATSGYCAQRAFPSAVLRVALLDLRNQAPLSSATSRSTGIHPARTHALTARLEHRGETLLASACVLEDRALELYDLAVL